jgi:bifunctional non-homologous end joining protein LigD
MKRSSKRAPKQSLKQSLSPLDAYGAKRNFERTSEPRPKLAKGGDRQFVVQKHDARRVHFDLRLELDGVLLSWACPNGPSNLPTDKRLAVRTEDHPLKYLDFEGAIPKGEYGGGTMIVWDRGRWGPVHDPHKSLAKGHLEFALDGNRLKGRWHLVRMKARPKEKKEQWLLIKADDEFARAPAELDLLSLEDTSVLSGLTNRDLENGGAVRKDHESRARVSANRKTPDIGRIKGARKALLQLFVDPSLASAAEMPPSGDQWWHEVKFDGYRIQARIDADEIRLLTRTGLDWTTRFASVGDAVRGLRLGSAVLDGEIVVENDSGVSSFNELVSDLKTNRQDRFRYYVFDLLYLNGADLRGATLADRKRLLSEILSEAPTEKITLSEHFEVDGAALFEQAGRLGLEGIVSKRRDAPYRSGRGKEWLKIKCVLRQEFVVVGYAPSSTSRGIVGSLVLGFYENGSLFHAGRVGTGFSQDVAAALFETLNGDRIDDPRFANKVSAEAAINVRWVTPRLVVEVEYRGWSNDGLLRHSVFRGLREDREPISVTLEDLAAPVASASTAAALTSADRMLWPADGVTKQGLADFYVEIADWILPHLIGRPSSVFRCPGGVDETCFYAKHEWAGLDRTVRRVDVGKDGAMLVVENLPGLLALVQASVLEIHPWGSTVADIERPDRLIFDLDPGDGVSWREVVDGALEVRERLKTALKLESFVKTTGGKGLHVVAPLVPAMEWEPAKLICKSIAEAMAADSPGRFIARMTKSARREKIFVDYLRNGRGATAVAAYSTRARTGATVSTPLGWEELSDAVKSDHFRVDNLGRRLAQLRRDPWIDFFAVKQRLTRPISARKRK